MFGSSIVLYYHIIRVFIEDSHVSHNFLYFGNVLMDPPIELKQTKSPDFENMFKFTQVWVKYDTLRFVVYSSQVCLCELSSGLWC